MQPALTSWNLNQWTKTDMTESSPWRRWAAGSWRARTRARHLGQQNGCLQPNRIKQVATITNSNRITITDWCSEQTAICWVLLLFFFILYPSVLWTSFEVSIFDQGGYYWDQTSPGHPCPQTPFPPRTPNVALVEGVHQMWFLSNSEQSSWWPQTGLCPKEGGPIAKA